MEEFFFPEVLKSDGRRYFQYPNTWNPSPSLMAFDKARYNHPTLKSILL